MSPRTAVSMDFRIISISIFVHLYVGKRGCSSNTRTGTTQRHSQCKLIDKDMVTGSNPLGDPTFSLPSPFSDEARLSGSGMIKTESSNPFYYWKHNIYSLFHTYFSGSKEIFPLCLTSCGHDRCLKLEVPLSEETHT